MTALHVLRANAIAYIVLLCLFCLVVPYQWRISRDTIHDERTLDFFIPFLLDPFTDRVSDRDYVANWERGHEFETHSHAVLCTGDRLLNVDGRDFLGMSIYLRELQRKLHESPPAPPDFKWQPFTVTVRSRDSRIHVIQFGFPQCTCGIPTRSQAAAFWLIPQMFCILIGFATAYLRPKALLAWAFPGTMLSLSQLQFWNDWYTGFQLTATPMTWAGWFRVPAVGYRTFVQNAWPAFVFLACAHFVRSRRRAYGLAIGLAGAFFAFATIQAALQIAWSEDYHKLVWLYRILDHHRVELMPYALLLITSLAWFVNRKLGAAETVVWFSAFTALLCGPAGVGEGAWYTFSDGTHRFLATKPRIHNAPGFVVLLFAAGSLVAALIVARREITRHEFLSLTLCLPLTIHVALSLGEFLYPFDPGPFEYWPFLVLISAGTGLTGIAWSVLRRTDASQRSSASAWRAGQAIRGTG